MQTNLLEYLEATAPKYAHKLAFSNGETGVTFEQVYNYSRSVGTAIHQRGLYSRPIVVFMEKSPAAVCAFFGAVYAGCYYVPLDEEMPRHRIELILDNLKPEMIICDQKTAPIAAELGCAGISLFDELISTPADDAALARIREKAIDCDCVYIVFTSGSTGVPKGVAACHRSVIDYIENLSEVLQVSEDTVFGNQAPFYFDACLKELYPTIKFGATTYIVPKALFMQPVALVEFLNKHKINTICWVVSALTVISGLGAFREITPETLRTVAFGSEVFPIKQFNLWRGVLPEARFINLYGPTEATGMSCYYLVDRDFAEGDVIPIGRPFRNTGVILLGEEGGEAAEGQPGELLIRGTPVTLGYYNDPERTAEAFIQNPLNSAYPETVYRTGDIVRRNDRGELEFISRKDHQIKHMGHRIELGEIEIIAAGAEGVAHACCVFDDTKKKLVLFYTGEAESAGLVTYIKGKLPRYMTPNAVIRLEQMPFTPNGKLNRRLLKEDYISGKYR